MVNQSIIETASKYVKQISKSMDVRRAYLFGSYANGMEKVDSDIDIAVVIADMKDFFETQMQLMRSRRNIDLRIEPHPINESDFNDINPFVNEIQKTGIEIDLK